MTAENFDKDNVSTSKLYMLRCVIAMAHADGEVCDEERAYMHAIMNRIPLSKEQRNTLDQDMNNAQDIGALFKHINDPRYRGQVVYFARLIAHKNGILTPSEQDLLERLHALATDGLDMEAIRADVKQALTLEMNQIDMKTDQYRPEGGIFGLFDRLLLWSGIDLMRD